MERLRLLGEDGVGCLTILYMHCRHLESGVLPRACESKADGTLKAPKKGLGRVLFQQTWEPEFKPLAPV